MAKKNTSMADNLPGNQQLGVPIQYGGPVGDDAAPDPDRSADIYNDDSGYTPGVADPQAELGGKPVGRFQKVVGPALTPAMVPATPGADLSHENPVRCMDEYYKLDQMAYLGTDGETFGINYSGAETLGKGFANTGGPVLTPTDHAANTSEDARRKTTRIVDKPALKDANKP